MLPFRESQPSRNMRVSGNIDRPLQRDGEAAISGAAGGLSPPGTSPPARADGLTSLGQLQLRHSLDGLRPAASLTFIDRPLMSRLSGDLDHPKSGAPADVSEQTDQQSEKGGEGSSGQLAVPEEDQAVPDGSAVTNQQAAELRDRFQNVVGVDGSKARDDWSEFVG